MYSFSYLKSVFCSMSSSNCCFLACIQISQESGQVVWYSHLFQNFPQFIVIHTVKGFGIVNKAEIYVFSGTLLLFPWSRGCWQFVLWFLYFNKTLLRKSSEWSSLVSGPRLNSSPPGAKNPGVFVWFNNNLSLPQFKSSNHDLLFSIRICFLYHLEQYGKNILRCLHSTAL